MFYKRHEVVRNNLTDLRKNAKYTQQQLADMVGVTRQTIISIEKGNYTPSVLLALKLSDILKKPIGELFWL